MISLIHFDFIKQGLEIQISKFFQFLILDTMHTIGIISLAE